MVPTITNPIAQFVGAALLAVLMLCLSAAILRADEGHSAKHCRIYFGCLPDLTKQRGPLN
jgi:hypothetical protein